MPYPSSYQTYKKIMVLESFKHHVFLGKLKPFTRKVFSPSCSFFREMGKFFGKQRKLLGAIVYLIYFHFIKGN